VSVNATPQDRQLALAPLDENVDHVRGAAAARLIIGYGDYQCPYSRQAYRAIEQVERQLGGTMRFAFRHFPLTGIDPHALAHRLGQDLHTLRAQADGELENLRTGSST
jgi:protein-disulfide isomerase